MPLAMVEVDGWGVDSSEPTSDENKSLMPPPGSLNEGPDLSDSVVLVLSWTWPTGLL